MARSAREMQPLPAPGAKVVVRDEEWLVRSVKPSSQGRFAVHVTGAPSNGIGALLIGLPDPSGTPLPPTVRKSGR